MKMIAPSSGWPTREIELLIADPSPENRPGIEPISVLVSGATTIEMPRPKSRIAGRTSISVETGGISVAGCSKAAFHGVGIGRQSGEPEHRRRPSAAARQPGSGAHPAAPDSVPIRVDRIDSMMPTGMPTAPAPSAV